MKILFVASQTAAAETLAVEREINDVQRQLVETSLRPAEAVFLPDTTIESLPIELSRNRPDVLHISVHGDREGLWFAKRTFDQEKYVHLTPARFFAFLDPNSLPKLVFINACKSIEVAQFLATQGVMAIGTSAPITNEAAIAASRLLYERLLGGRSVSDAFNAIDALVSTIDDDRVTLELCVPEGADPATTILHRVPRLTARLAGSAVVKPGKEIAIELGVVGCPPETRQIVFFTDDRSFESGTETLADDLCEVVQDTPRRGEIWTEESWRTEGNFRAAACGITAGGLTFSVSGHVVEALNYYSQIADASPEYLDLVSKAVKHLHEHDGAGLIKWDNDKRKKAAKASGPTESDRP